MFFLWYVFRYEKKIQELLPDNLNRTIEAMQVAGELLDGNIVSIHYVPQSLL